MAASCVTACGIARILTGKLDMEVVLNATLAGGVAIGAAADLITHPAYCMGVGAVSGIISALGFMILNPYLQTLGFHDTCGVLNLHGMPGVFGALVSVVAVSASTIAY
jgi:ammonium transporter Rh